jgi:hypothetical protein
MMNQEDIFKKIGHILNELNDQYQYLAQNPEELNELELELFLANASFLTDHVQIVRKLNGKASQKALPEHASFQEEIIEKEPVIPVKEIEAPIEAAPEVLSVKPVLEDEIFKIDKEPSTFEFILNEKPTSDRFEFEERPIDEIFDRPLSKEEEQIIAQKQKLREMDSLESQLPEEDEIGPEPFLVSEPFKTESFTPVPEPGTPKYPGPLKEPEAVQEPDFLKEKKAEDYPFVPQSAGIAEEEAPAGEDLTEPEPPEQEKPAVEIAVEAEPVVQKELFNPVQPKAETLAAAPETFTAMPAKEELSSEGQPKARPTLNDILSGSAATKNFNTGTGRAAVTDLKQAISLNDKMRYIKDLFNGYNLAYAEAIDLLNKMPDFKTADAFLKNNYAVKNNWAAKQDTADQFYELLNQRFPAK